MAYMLDNAAMLPSLSVVFLDATPELLELFK